MTKEQTTGEATADLTTLLDCNRSFAEQFAAGDLCANSLLTQL